MTKRILYKINLIIVFLLIINISAWSQKAKDLKKLQELQKQDTEPAFTALKEPERYKNESMVMLAEKLKVVQAKVKRNNTAPIIYDQYSVYARTRIKLNDLNAVENYSDFEFEDGDEFEVKIVKPDGKSIDVDLKDAVEAENIKTSNKWVNIFLNNKKKKIALKNLEVGDIIDFSSLSWSSSFIYSNTYFTNLTGMPIVYLKNEFKINKLNTVVVFKNFNGANTLIQKNEGKFVNYSYEGELIDKRKVEMMSKEAESEPFYKLDIYFDTKVYYPFIEKPTKNALKASLTKEEIISYVHNIFKKNKIYSTNYLDFMKSEDIYKLSDEDYVNKYYLFCRENAYMCKLAFNFKQPTFGVGMLTQFITHLEKRNIDYELLAMVSKEDLGIKNIINMEDFSYGIKYTINGKDHYITMFNSVSQIDDISEEFENTEAYAFSNFKNGLKKMEMETIKLKTSNHNENVYVIDIEASYNTLDSLNLQVKTETTGYQRNDSRFNLIDNKEYLKFYDKAMIRKTKRKKLYYFANLYYYNINKTFFDKEEARIGADYFESLEKTKRNNLENDARSEYYVLKYDKYTPISDGRFSKNPSAVWKEQFTIGNTLLPAGKSYVFEIGKVLGKLSMISDNEDRKARTKPFFIDYNRTFTMNVKIKIPEGKSVVGLETLNMNETNNVGSITSNAKVENGYIVWSFTKKFNGYKHEASDWNNYVKITDLGMQLNTSKIILN
ncbi:MAG: DUF3857 domain-containing protein [Candidatus Methylacidiphilales bacterium]